MIKNNLNCLATIYIADLLLFYFEVLVNLVLKRVFELILPSKGSYFLLFFYKLCLSKKKVKTKFKHLVYCLFCSQEFRRENHVLNIEK